MNRKTLVWTSAAFYALAWLIPVDRVGMSGWQAFRSALAPLLPYEGIVITGARDVLLSVTSASSNLLFVAGFFILVLRPDRRSRGLFWALLLAGGLNTHWFVLSDDRGDFGFGYFLWVGSFLLLSVSASRWSPRGAKVATSGI